MMGDSWEQFLADCPECEDGYSACVAADCGVQPNFIWSPECFDCVKELQLPPEDCLDCQPHKSPADCIQCRSQLLPNCTPDCFVALDECDLCLSGPSASSSSAVPAPVWPLLALNSPLPQPDIHLPNLFPPLPPMDWSTATSSHFLCQWSGCTSTFDNHDELRKHVNEQHLCHPLALHFGHTELHHQHGQEILKKHHHHMSPDVASTPSSEPSVAADGERVCGWQGCGVVCAGSTEMMEHLNTEHVASGLAEYRCLWDDCKREKSFPQRQKLLRHLQTHAGASHFGLCVLA
jgi:hypothetical protein